VVSGQLTRTPASSEIIPTLTYTVLTAPKYGVVNILCGGREAANSSCIYTAGGARGPPTRSLTVYS